MLKSATTYEQAKEILLALNPSLAQEFDNPRHFIQAEAIAILLHYEYDPRIALSFTDAHQLVALYILQGQRLDIVFKITIYELLYHLNMLIEMHQGISPSQLDLSIFDNIDPLVEPPSIELDHITLIF